MILLSLVLSTLCRRIFAQPDFACHLSWSLEPSHGALSCTSWRSGWSIFGWMTLEERWSHPESRAGTLKIKALPKGHCWTWHHDKHMQSKKHHLILRPISTVSHNLLTDTVWDACTGFQLIYIYSGLTFIQACCLPSSSGNLSFPPLHTCSVLCKTKCLLLTSQGEQLLSTGSMGYSIKLKCSLEVLCLKLVI